MTQPTPKTVEDAKV